MTGIVIPIYKDKLSKYEWTSVEQCCRILHSHPIILLTNDRINACSIREILLNKHAHLNVSIEYFNKDYFKDINGYNQLMLSKGFYERFQNLRYILIYQLDAFVFRDELNYWNELEYDYIGAPWFEEFSDGNENESLWRVGNGGLSLRNTKSFLNVLNKKGPVKKLSQLLKESQDKDTSKKMLYKTITGFKALGFRNTISYYKKFYNNEDGFWGILANEFLGLKVPLPLEALKFSFERNPRKLYEINKFSLPFGCHAWWKYDLQFWKPFIEQEGYVL